jgi:hypothetical protein
VGRARALPFTSIQHTASNRNCPHIKCTPTRLVLRQRRCRQSISLNPRGEGTPSWYIMEGGNGTENTCSTIDRPANDQTAPSPVREPGIGGSSGPCSASAQLSVSTHSTSGERTTSFVQAQPSIDLGSYDNSHLWYPRRHIDLAHARLSPAEAGRSGTGLYSRCSTVGFNVNDVNAWIHSTDTERLV